MAIMKYVVPALMASSLALAQSTDPCDGSQHPIVIKSQSDADALSSCQTIKGDIVIDKSAQNSITFSGIQQITGSLSALQATNVTSITASQLSSIGKTLDLENIILLSNLQFDSLTSVGAIKFSALPNLQGLSFTQGVTQAGSVSIENTGLTSIKGINLKSVGDFDLTANLDLTDVNVNNIRNITGLVNIAGNSNKLSVDFPNLVSGKNMTFRNTSSISVPSLQNLTGQLGLFGTYLSSFSAPNLTLCGDLGFYDNNALTNISLPALITVNGGLSIWNNNKLTNITGFPALQTVTGAVDIVGDYTEVSLPALKEVKGGFNAQSNANFDCSQFDTLRSNNVIQGTYTCTANNPHPSGMGGGSGSGSGSGSSATATSSGAAVGNLAVAPVTGLTAVIGGLLALLM